MIAGPTASGKTELGIEVAKQVNGEVVNFDSLLFYKELNIGTAKPDQNELSAVPHHLVSTHSIARPINAADYSELCHPIISEIHARARIPILVGGSGFYLQAVMYGMFESVTSPASVLEKSESWYQQKGIQPFRDVLKENDPKSYERYHENDHYRIRRAVEHFWTTGQTISSAREKQMQERQLPEGWNLFFTYLDIPKSLHLPIIEKRTEKMFQQGLIQEVKELLDAGFTGREKPMQSIGYKEVVSYLKDEFPDLESCKERISINTRQLAKSQRTWFKKMQKNEYNPLEERDKFIKDCKQFVLD